jgi:hypothetical protein
MTHEMTTTLVPEEVVRRAREFFLRRMSLGGAGLVVLPRRRRPVR